MQTQWTEKVILSLTALRVLTNNRQADRSRLFEMLLLHEIDKRLSESKNNNREKFCGLIRGCEMLSFCS